MVPADLDEHGSKSFSQVRTLLDEMMNAELVKKLHVVLLRACAHRNDRAALSESLALELHAELDAVHAGHVQVDAT